MTLDDLKRLRAHLRCIRDDPDGTLTAVQSYELALATRRVRDEIVRLEADGAAPTRVVPTIGDLNATAPDLARRTVRVS